MRPAPRFLPPLHSSKWNNRRGWDSLGYFRVQKLADPAWKRDLATITTSLRRELRAATGQGRVALERALESVDRYDRLHRHDGERVEDFEARRELLWDDFLDSLDEFLALRQAAHLRAVDDAGCSGRS